MSDQNEVVAGENPILMDMLTRYPILVPCRPSIQKAADVIINSYINGGRVMVCGNGGSAADAEHIVGELMKGFMRKRPLPDDKRAALQALDAERGKKLSETLQVPLPALALTGQLSLSTAFANDADADLVFAQQVLGYGRKGDVIIGISTSGNAGNVINALITAKMLEIATIGLTGASGGHMAEHCDILVSVPETSTPLIQELHLPVYHTICRITESYFFAE